MLHSVNLQKIVFYFTACFIILFTFKMDLRDCDESEIIVDKQDCQIWRTFYSVIPNSHQKILHSFLLVFYS